MIAKEDGASFWSDKNILKLTIVVVAHICEYPKTTELYILTEWIVQGVNCISINLFLK